MNCIVGFSSTFRNYNIRFTNTLNIYNWVAIGKSMELVRISTCNAWNSVVDTVNEFWHLRSRETSSRTVPLCPGKQRNVAQKLPRLNLKEKRHFVPTQRTINCFNPRATCLRRRKWKMNLPRGLLFQRNKSSLSAITCHDTPVF